MNPIIPKPDDVNQCLFHLIQKTPHPYDALTEQYAQMRLADFSEVLHDWANNENALPQVAKIMQHGKVPAEYGEKLLAWLKQAAEQGNLTAMLYLAYLSAKGMVLPQSLPRAVMLAKKVSDAGDWRGTQLLAELLAVAHCLATDIMGQEITTRAQNWYRPNIHPNITPNDIQAACKSFLTSEIAVKQMVRQKMQLAIQQGSPTAAQRLRVWSIQGIIPPAEPVVKFRQIEKWLDAQLTTVQSHRHNDDDEDVMILPENIPFFVTETDEKPKWQKALLYGGVGLVILIFMAILLKSMLPH